MKRTPREALDAFPSPIDGHLAQKATAEIVIGCTENVVQSIDDLRGSLKATADANNKLSERVFWLNVILTVATVAGTAAAILSFVFRK
ncbi:MAG: hypothetical protein WAU45_17000 [Blastocatellia bacterium]